MGISHWGLAEVVRTHGRDRPGSPAITYGSEVTTWSRLDERSSLVADALIGLGVGAGDRIGFVGKNTPEYFELLFGAAKVGAVMVAINWRLKSAEIQFIADDAGAKVLVVGEDFTGVVGELRETRVTPSTYMVLGSSEVAGALPYEDWLSDHQPVDPGHVAEPDEVAFQLYTSGTTGLPKGAMLSNANVESLNAAGESMFGINETSINLVVLPTFHIGGAGYALIGMALGCNTILLRDFDPARALEALSQHRVTNTFFVPAMLAFMSAVPGASDGDYSSLRSIIYGASPITDETLKAAMRTFGCDFFQVYGLTETTGAITQLRPEDHDPDGPRSHLLRSAGKPFDWVEIRLVDPETGGDRPTGEVGELWTRSRQNMKGYWNNDEATVEAVRDDGWLRTGDAGYLDDDGYLFLTDRVTDMIVSGGENVYPAEVENVLSAHPAIADVAVIGVPDPRWGETAKAVVVLKPGANADPNEIVAFVRERIAHFKCPTSVDFIDVLPRNPSGKVLKRELREPYWEGRERRVG